MRSYVKVIVLNAVIMLAVILLNTYYIGPFVIKYVKNLFLAELLSVIIGIAMMSPFIWALIRWYRKFRATPIRRYGWIPNSNT